MSSYVFMRVLESAPERYDLGMRILSRGRIGGIYAKLADRVAAPGRRVLDVGCGTGGAALACAVRGAHVVGIDRNAGMLAAARAKPPPPGEGRVEWLEIGAAEIEDRFPENSFEAVVSCLAFSEMDPPDQDYALASIRMRLTPGGRLVIADEVLPEGRWRRIVYRLVRLPQLVLTWVIAQTTTRPLAGLAARVRAAGFEAITRVRPWGDAFEILEARAPRGTR